MDSKREHPLRQVKPDFLDRLDDDRDEAWKGFYEFGWKLLESSPPRVLSGLDPDARREAISHVLHRCAENDFRVLRRYRPRGIPFAVWLRRVASNHVNDGLRREGRRQVPLDDRHVEAPDLRPDPARDHESRELLEAVQRALAELSEKCRLLLEAAADGLRPRQMTSLLGLPAHQNKKVGDQLRECRRTLERRLRRDGWDLSSEGAS